jgi:3-methyladenine DNA glycosylase/8-oxoguanine DNA glycosylase
MSVPESIVFAIPGRHSHRPSLPQRDLSATFSKLGALTVERSITPRGPYSLRLSAGRASDSCRRCAGARLVGLFHVGERLEWAGARQAPDGRIELEALSEEGLEHIERALGLRDDHSEFLRRFRDDPLLRTPIRFLRGLRPARLGTVAHALLRAVAGQLVEARRARAIERRVIHAVTDEVWGLHAPPTAGALGRLAPAELQRLGLSARKAATIVRLCRTVDLERLTTVDSDSVAMRLERERGLGPWSVGVIFLEGLGRFDRGLVGDLGLMKLCRALTGRSADAADTEELLEPYGDWAGLASVYLLAGFARGLLPIPAGGRRRARTRVAA